MLSLLRRLLRPPSLPDGSQLPSRLAEGSPGRRHASGERIEQGRPATALQRLADVHAAWSKQQRPSPETFSQVVAQADTQAGDTARLDIWLRLQPLGSPTPGARLESSLRWLSALATVLGIILGMGFMAGLVAHDGQQQVNLLWLLGLAMLQLLLSALALTLLLRARKRTPLLSELVGHLPRALYRGPLRQLMDAPHEDQSDFARLHTPWLLLLTQRFALAFALSALATLLGYITLQDIAFGWSTTLQLRPDTLHSVLQAIALPWGWLWPGAVPSLALVETSQFYRLAENPAADPTGLGRWWTFLFMTWLVYAVLPRLLLLRLCQRRWAAISQQVLRESPLYQRTVRRLYFDHAAARSDAAAMISNMLVSMITHQETRDVPGLKTLNRDQMAGLRTRLEADWRAALAQQEAATYQALMALYQRQHQAPELDIPDGASLFRTEGWARWGLTRARLAVILGAMGGGAGAAVDLGTGGTTLGLGAALGGIAGAGTGYFSGSRLAVVTADDGRMVCGPATNKQLQSVILGRAISVWQQLVRLQLGEVAPATRDSDWRDVLSTKEQGAMLKELARIAKRPATDETPDDTLQKMILALLIRCSPPGTAD